MQTPLFPVFKMAIRHMPSSRVPSSKLSAANSPSFEFSIARNQGPPLGLRIRCPSLRGPIINVCARYGHMQRKPTVQRPGWLCLMLLPFAIMDKTPRNALRWGGRSL